MSLLEVTVDEPNVALLRLNSPETRNALSPAMKDELLLTLRRLDHDPEIRCVVVAGSDEFFAAGADIRALAERSIEAPRDPEAEAFWAGLAELRTPLVAAVCGYALGGGCELALACDVIVADKEARFGLPEVTLGIIPGGGGTQRLTRALGKHRAMEYVLTGRRFDAEMARDWGLVNQVAPKRAWLRTALELAHTIAERPPIATRLGKQAVLAADELPLLAGIAAERQLFDEAMATEDRVEGMQAFIEKREPDFKGR